MSSIWAGGDAYEPYVGRWSRLVAREFLVWLAMPSNSAWLDAGCGTGALTQTILNVAAPSAVKGIDQSESYVAYARTHVQGRMVSFEVADLQSLPFDVSSYDSVVSGLVLNFLPQPGQAVAEMVRVTRPGGMVAAYVWDYAGEMQLMRYFWDAAVALEPSARPKDEGMRFPMCQPEPLKQLFDAARLNDIQVRAIDVPTHFRDFDDYWSPFLGGQGPAPSYAMSLDETHRTGLRDYLRAHLPMDKDGSIRLIARAWAVRGIV